MIRNVASEEDRINDLYSVVDGGDMGVHSLADVRPLFPHDLRASFWGQEAIEFDGIRLI